MPDSSSLWSVPLSDWSSFVDVLSLNIHGRRSGINTNVDVSSSRITLPIYSLSIRLCEEASLSNPVYAEACREMAREL